MLARSGTPHGTVVSAKSQSAGRGRHGRQWVSPEGNLYASLIVRFDLPLARARELGFLAALSVADVAQAYLPATKRVRVKWPNDVLVDGQKLAGILVEGERCQKRAWWAVVGIGVNVLEAPFGLPYPATSLRKEGAGEAGAPEVLSRLLDSLGARLDGWATEGFAPIRSGWLERAHELGGIVRVCIGERTIVGKAVDFDSAGALIVEAADGRHRVMGGELSESALAE
jgi:BirA family biotin operon repressor/biotin-[acetyl-CoA-carboxylase] ligase